MLALSASSLRKSAALRGSGCTKPTESRPILEPLLHQSRAFLQRSFAFLERCFDGFAERLTCAERAQDGKLLALDAAEINRIVHAVDGQENRSRLELGHCLHALALVPLLKGIAGEIGVFIFLADFQQKIIDRILQVEQTNVGLQLQAKICSRVAAKIFRTK